MLFVRPQTAHANDKEHPRHSELEYVSKLSYMAMKCKQHLIAFRDNESLRLLGPATLAWKFIFYTEPYMPECQCIAWTHVRRRGPNAEQYLQVHIDNTKFATLFVLEKRASDWRTESQSAQLRNCGLHDYKCSSTSWKIQPEG